MQRKTNILLIVFLSIIIGTIGSVSSFRYVDTQNNNYIQIGKIS